MNLKTVTVLSPGTERRLCVYALSATAALLGAPKGEAKIVYTRADKIIGPRQHYALDLNHDKTTDFTLSNQYAGSSLFQSATLQLVDGAKPNAGVNHYSFAIPLNFGDVIGSQQNFLAGANLAMARTSKSSEFTYSGGPFLNVKRKFLGLRFTIKGKVHYGWARVTVTPTGHGLKLKLLDYAYSSIPNHPIHAGQGIPHSSDGPRDQSLGVLARGAPQER